GAQDENLGAFDGDAHFQGPDHTGRVGIEAIQISVLGAHYRIAGTDLGGVGIGVVEVGENCRFVRHGHGQPMNRNVADAGQQVFQSLGVQREVDAVYRLAS